eukprot:1719923-Amphidinium_carterae.1
MLLFIYVLVWVVQYRAYPRSSPRTTSQTPIKDIGRPIAEIRCRCQLLGTRNSRTKTAQKTKDQ